MRIALDAMGGDLAPRATVEGAVTAARELGLSVLLVGDRARIEPELARHRTTGLDLEVRHATQMVAMDEAPTAALRKADSSMSVGLASVRDGETGAFVFAGNTGAGMVLGAHLLGRTAGVERPAIAVLVPSPRGQTILLDAGANVDCRPIHLTQFAVMGDAYARAVRQIAAPRVGLLSNGLEDGKGNALVRAAAPMLRQLPINFVGYVEGRELSSGGVDVVVCDGFVGNLVLKGLEGFGQLIGERLRAMFQQGLRTRLAYLLLRGEVARLRRDLDPRETGGALLLGLNGIVVKAHGSSDAHAIRNALAVAATLAQSDVTEQVALGVAATVGLEPAVDDVTQAPRARRLWNALRDRLRRDKAIEREEETVEVGPPRPATSTASSPGALSGPGSSAPGAADGTGTAAAPTAPVAPTMPIGPTPTAHHDDVLAVPPTATSAVEAPRVKHEPQSASSGDELIGNDDAGARQKADR
jgi:glycerol-3-phosphate acyltransferase PlsX